MFCLGEYIPAGHYETPTGADCDDGNPFIWNQHEVWWDSDQDGFTALGSHEICVNDELPLGATLTQSILTDCDDDNPDMHPIRCQDINAQCGLILDGCGGVKDCGGCYDPDTCGGGGIANQCGCSPLTCEMAGAECGDVADGCDRSLFCGDCFGHETCGGAGVANQCGCTPLTCEVFSSACGVHENGCGDTIDCGPCLELEDGGVSHFDGGQMFWDGGEEESIDGGGDVPRDSGSAPWEEQDPPWAPNPNNNGEDLDDRDGDDRDPDNLKGCACQHHRSQKTWFHSLGLFAVIVISTRRKRKTP